MRQCYRNKARRESSSGRCCCIRHLHCRYLGAHRRIYPQKRKRGQRDNKRLREPFGHYPCKGNKGVRRIHSFKDTGAGGKLPGKEIQERELHYKVLQILYPCRCDRRSAAGGHSLDNHRRPQNMDIPCNDIPCDLMPLCAGNFHTP